MSKQLTAVDFIVQVLKDYDLSKIELFEKSIKQAKELEKNQLENSYLQGFCECDSIGVMDFEQYFKRTFKHKL